MGKYRSALVGNWVYPKTEKVFFSSTFSQKDSELLSSALGTQVEFTRAKPRRQFPTIHFPATH
jgi:hypothetical protein